MPATTPAEKERAQRIAVSALARGRTNQEASDLAQISRRTLQGWLQDAAFRSRIGTERERLVEQEPDAVAVLRRALTDPTVTANQIRAAQVLLSAVPEEQPDTQPTVVHLHLSADIIREVEELRRADAREASREFHRAQDEQATQVRKLYSPDDG